MDYFVQCPCCGKLAPLVVSIYDIGYSCSCGWNSVDGVKIVTTSSTIQYEQPLTDCKTSMYKNK